MRRRGRRVGDRASHSQSRRRRRLSVQYVANLPYSLPERDTNSPDVNTMGVSREGLGAAKYAGNGDLTGYSEYRSAVWCLQSGLPRSEADRRFLIFAISS